MAPAGGVAAVIDVFCLNNLPLFAATDTSVDSLRLFRGPFNFCFKGIAGYLDLTKPEMDDETGDLNYLRE